MNNETPKVQPPICPACREALVKIIDARIRRMLEAGRGESEEALESEQAAAFHLVELQRVLRGEPTSGVFDDYGPPVTITGPLFDVDREWTQDELRAHVRGLGADLDDDEQIPQYCKFCSGPEPPSAEDRRWAEEWIERHGQRAAPGGAE